MSNQTIAALKATRLDFLKTLRPVIVDKPKEKAGEKGISTMAELPLPTQEDVDDMRTRYEDDQAILDSGRRKLENRKSVLPCYV